MREGWRWYGEFDKISLPEIAQTGATEIVTALHGVPYGDIWQTDAIQSVNARIRNAGFNWNVVESLPIHERIKRGDGDLSGLFANYRQSMANLAAEGIKVICYNFMPLVDWTRTDLRSPVKRGGTCLRFSIEKIAALDVYMIEREGAEADFTPETLRDAKRWFDASTTAERDALIHAVMCGLPGAYDRYDAANLKQALAGYEGIGRSEIRDNYKRFLDEVIPAAEELGLRFGVHPDDPPRDIFGLPRIVSNADDIDWVLNAHKSPANGLTFCAGSLGANPSNDLPSIAQRFADKIHFIHLRNVTKEPNGSFEEAAHLDGDTDMPALVSVLLKEEKRRQTSGRDDHQMVFRPDHGHELLDDESKQTHPGYPLVGRMKGLAEIRGLIDGLKHNMA
ncbi:MAG: mannonate dehydratase [Rhodobacteraceae bacterium]|nr:mannonate dehydratase [Paracoccaceae bacterium]